MDDLSRISFDSYRDLVENPSLLRYFQEATPIEQIVDRVSVLDVTHSAKRRAG